MAACLRYNSCMILCLSWLLTVKDTQDIRWRSRVLERFLQLRPSLHLQLQLVLKSSSRLALLLQSLLVQHCNSEQRVEYMWLGPQRTANEHVLALLRPCLISLSNFLLHTHQTFVQTNKSHLQIIATIYNCLHLEYKYIQTSKLMLEMYLTDSNND